MHVAVKQMALLLKAFNQQFQVVRLQIHGVPLPLEMIRHTTKHSFYMTQTTHEIQVQTGTWPGMPTFMTH
mgnify:CR=1 FL=1